MKFFRLNQLIAALLLSTSAFVYSDDAVSKQSIKLAGKITKEVYANRFMTYLNNTVLNDAAFRYRTTLDGNFLAQYGDLKKNPKVEVKGTGRFRYDVGTAALVKTASASLSVAGTSFDLPSTSVQKTLLFLRELSMKISLDENEEGSDHYLKFGSFPYELGRGIALGAAYNSGGFLGLDPRFSIDQFASGAIFHTDLYHDSLSMDVYFALLANPNGSLRENVEKIRVMQVMDPINSTSRGPNRGVWFGSGSFNWDAIDLEDCKLTVNPYLYMHVSPDQTLEFVADTDSQIYGIGTALEFKVGKFEWGFEGSFQGGKTDIKAWDRNLTKLVNDNGIATFQYTKVYTDADLTTLADATTVNQTLVDSPPEGYQQNGKQIGTSGLYNAIDRYRPAQAQFYHGYFFVTDASYEFIDGQLKLCGDVGYVSGQLDDLYDINGLTQEELLHRDFNGFVPIQSVYSGKRIQHLVMLNTGVPRFTVDNPTLSTSATHVASRVTGVATLTDKFTNLAYTALALELKPVKFKDQKLVLKPAAIYYWMAQAPFLADGITVASHALGTALSLELEATLKECINIGGYVGLMIPGTQYQQFAKEGLQLKGGALGSNTAYVYNFSMAYKF